MKQIACLAVLLLFFSSCQYQTNHTEPMESGNSATADAQQSFEDGTDSSQPEIEKNDSAKIEISMEEAVAMATEEANKYYDGLKLTEVHSYDNDESRSVHAGENGKRQWWYVNFGNEAFHYVSILIKDGEIVSVNSFDEEWHQGWFDLSDLQITSEEAVKKAAEIGLCGGDPENDELEWVSGFNYKLEYGSLIENPNEELLFLDVIGVSQNRNFARVSFNASTGEVLLAMEMFEYETDEVEWKPFSNMSIVE